MATFGTTIGSGGIRFYDANHTVAYNYVQGVYGGPFQGPLEIDSGDVEGTSTDLAAHWRVVGALVERNVIVGCPEGIRIGDNYTLAPTGITLRDNVVAQAVSGTAVTAVRAPVSSTATNNTYASTPAGASLIQDSAGIWRRTDYGPRISYLQVADVGINGDVNDIDGSGTGDTGGGTPPPVSSPTFVAMGAAVTGSATSITVPAPGGIQSGDFHLVVITSTASETITGVPVGWSLLGYQPMTSPTSPDRGGAAVAAAYYTLNSSGSVTFAKSGTGFYHAVRGVWRGVGGVEQAGVTVAAAGSPLATPAVTSANTDSVVVGVVAADLPSVSAGPYTPPAGWTERYDTTQTGGTDNLSIAIAEVSAGSVVTTPSGSAADSFGWGNPLTASDTFTYTGAPASSKWEVLAGSGFNGNGTRSAARVTVDGSSMVITGLAGSAATGAALHNVWQIYGRWEARIRSAMTGSTGTNNYRVALLLSPADGVLTPFTAQQDEDTSDSVEYLWPHTPGLPTGRLVCYFTTSGLSARYASLVQQGCDIWSRSSTIQAIAVPTDPGGGANFCTMRTQSIGSDPDTDAETDTDDTGNIRRSAMITMYTDWLDGYPDSGALATIVHEMGHVFGIRHRKNTTDLMNANTDENTSPIPDVVDFSNIAFRYGAGAGGQYVPLEAAQAGQTGSTITLHYPRLSGADTTQTATVAGLDLSQWHNFAVEWSSAQVVVWVDGVERIRRSGGAAGTLRDIQNTMGPMRLCVQLDALASSGMRAAQMEVDWANAYPIVPVFGAAPRMGSSTQSLDTAMRSGFTRTCVRGRKRR